MWKRKQLWKIISEGEWHYEWYMESRIARCTAPSIRSTRSRSSTIDVHFPKGFNPLLHSTYLGDNQRPLLGKAAGFLGRTSAAQKQGCSRWCASRSMDSGWSWTGWSRLWGGIGRTGTALACLAVIDGVPNHKAVDYIRQHYTPRAVETTWQRHFVSRFK